MPDRFHKGNSDNDPKWRGPVRHSFRKKKLPSEVIPWTMDWQKAAPWEVPHDGRFVQRMYGGDIQGIEQKLDYLKALGITAILMNPIFGANGHHKYGTLDYCHIDDNLTLPEQAMKVSSTLKWTWTDGDHKFLEFLKTPSRAFALFSMVSSTIPADSTGPPQAHQRRSRLAFCPLVSHRRLGRLGPRRRFEKNTRRVNYKGFMGYKTMPKLDLTHPEVREYLLNITRR